MIYERILKSYLEMFIIFAKKWQYFWEDYLILKS